MTRRRWRTGAHAGAAAGARGGGHRLRDPPSHRRPDAKAAGPVLCALSAIAQANGRSAAELLGGAVDTLDGRMFGKKGAKPRFRVSKPTVVVRGGATPESLVCVGISIRGAGAFTSGAASLAPLNALLWRLVQQKRETIGRKGARGAPERGWLADALFADTGRVEAVLCLGAEVTLAKDEREALTGRLQSAWEHARGLEPRLRGTVDLRICDKPPSSS